jgi:hypothetical protein
VPSFYTQRVEASGFPIVASGKVNPYALKEAAYLLDLMLAKRPDVRAAMIQSGARLCVMAPRRIHHRPARVRALEAERLLGRPRPRPRRQHHRPALLVFRGKPARLPRRPVFDRVHLHSTNSRTTFIYAAWSTSIRRSTRVSRPPTTRR